MLSRQNSLFDWNQTFRARIWHLQNLLHKKMSHNDSWVWFKNARKWICITSCSRDRIQFLIGIKPSELKAGISRIECKRKFDTIHSRICSKSCSNGICSVSWFRQISRFLTEIKPSKLQSGISRMERRKNLTQLSRDIGLKSFKLNFQCVILPRQK